MAKIAFEELAVAINNVLDYSMEDAIMDYETTEDESEESDHILHSLRILEKWLDERLFPQA